MRYELMLNLEEAVRGHSANITFSSLKGCANTLFSFDAFSYFSSPLLASFRFEKPLMSVFRASLPFFLINLIAVLVITFVPAISVGVVHWFGF